MATKEYLNPFEQAAVTRHNLFMQLGRLYDQLVAAKMMETGFDEQEVADFIFKQMKQRDPLWARVFKKDTMSSLFDF